MKALVNILMFAVTGLGLQACNEEVVATPEAVAPPAVVELTKVQGFMADPAALQRGEALFVGTCAGYCHTLTRETTDALFLFDCEWKHGGTDDQIFNTITVGVPNTRMVGFGTNFPEGDDDKWKLIAFMRSKQETCS